ncbi:Peptidyl-prolyl cis-trans isomerase-like 2 [Penicillium verhagenii]|nr:Peptidyl-prolyl cis-trans isomerase-like 2 [Penicillium verhagenii]
MGKGTDKLYITHSEWASEDAFSASAGAGVGKARRGGPHAAFKRLPFNFCSLSLQPFAHPVCTHTGIIFDLTNIIPWIKKHGTNPVDGSPLKSSDLIKLTIAKNEEGEGKLWRDLVTDEEFSRKDIITLQDPQNIESRDLSSFTYLKEGQTEFLEEQQASASVNTSALGSSAKILKAKEAVAKARADRAQQQANSAASKAISKTGAVASAAKPAELALLSEEEYMLKRGRVKAKGYARIVTTAGHLNLELYPEHAPKAVWNFIQLAKKGYYKDVTFHRNIKGFMLQGGDPTGTGRGGESVWGKYFSDEFDGPLKHDGRGTLSMANKGKNTNSSQFFFAYRALPHLDRKHTVFGRLIDDPTPSSTTLNALEIHPVEANTNRPTPEIRIKEVTVFVDPFEDFLNQKRAEEAKGGSGAAQEEDEGTRRVEDEHTTWTGKRVRGPGAQSNEGAPIGVGKYLQAALADRGEEDEIVEYVDEEPAPEPARKKMKGTGGFGDFSSW